MKAREWWILARYVLAIVLWVMALWYAWHDQYAHGVFDMLLADIIRRQADEAVAKAGG